jgi:polyisoprenoid-binding protein YceI
MNVPSTTTPDLLALLKDRTLAGDWVLDSRESSVRLKSKVFGLLPVNGVFREVSGRGTVSPDGLVSGTFTVAAASVDTGNSKRDTHLRSADFFDSDTHPVITFAVDGIRVSRAGVVVTGALTVRGRTRPLSFDAVATVPGDGGIWLDGKVRVNRGDFGLTWNQLGMVAQNSDLTIHAVFARP